MVRSLHTLLIILALATSCGKKPDKSSSGKRPSSQPNKPTALEKNQDKRESLFLAIEGGDQNLVKTLASEFNNLDFSYEGFSPLTKAVANDNIDIVRILVEANANPLSKDDSGESAFTKAIKLKSYSIFSYLVSTNALSKETRVEDLLALAINYAQEDIGISIIIYAKNIQFGNLCESAKGKRLTTLYYFCRIVIKNPNINISFLKKAANKGDTHYLSYANKRADLVSISNGHNLLSSALEIQRRDRRLLSLELLLSIGFSADGEVKDSLNPLLISVQKRDITSARLLLSAGANPNIFDKFNKSALFYAAQSVDTLLVDLLLKYGAKTYHSVHQGHRIYIHTACQNVRFDQLPNDSRTYLQYIHDYRKTLELLGCE